MGKSSDENFMQNGENINVKYQDTIFRDMFNSNKRMLLHLYKVLHEGEEDIDKISEDDLEIITLHNVITDRMRNDVAFKVKNTIMFLIEHQSTINWNMPFRMLLYYVTEVLDSLPDGIDSLHKRKRMKLPDVEFYVVYSGTDEWGTEWLRLSDAFYGKKEPMLDLVVKVIHERNCKDGILKDYLGFISLVKRYIEKYGRDEDNIRKAVLNAIDDYVGGKIEALPDFAIYLDKRREEIRGMYFGEIVESKRDEVLMEEAREEGREEGVILGTIKTYFKFGYKADRVIKEIADEYNLSQEEVRALLVKYQEL